MKQPTFCGRELLPLSVIEAARAGDPLAVERVLWYYEGYMDKLCRSICLAALRRQAACRSHGPVPAWPRRGQRIGSGGGPDCCLSGSPAPAAFQILCPLFHRSKLYPRKWTRDFDPWSRSADTHLTHRGRSAAPVL